MIRACLTMALICLSAAGLANETETISDKTQNFEKYEGYFDFYWDDQGGKIWLEIDRFDEEFLYQPSLATGVGSNDIGLDRAQLGRARIVRFERSGPRVLLVQSNTGFRAESDNEMERRAVRDAFAESVLWGFEVAAEQGGRVLVDASDFLLADTHGVVRRLARTEQGNFALDKSRSAFYLPRTRNFPQNSEFEATLTFTSNNPGAHVQSVTPTPGAVTVRQHHSFVQLPDDDFEPREWDPRSGFWSVEFRDYAAALGEPIQQRLIGRHRLQKTNPGAAASDVVEPIVYYVDSGTPEPVRSALVEGAKWWADAYEAAGFRNAFQVELLPPDADPMDVRYNVINWVHRSTRGWSYGFTVTDPRTGEIIKGHVTLGSLRVRQDMLIAAGLLGPFGADGSVDPRIEEMALARLRQLSAHEVGHTLGLSHNHAASTYGRASVMDYPHPMIRLNDNGELDFSAAYDVGIGEWDKVAIAWGHAEFDEEQDEAAALDAIIADALDRGMPYLGGQDARPAGTAHPTAHLWDNGSDPVAELGEVLKVRDHALSNFSPANIPLGAPMATLEETLVPVYYYHRYQVEAVAKILGGMDYTHAIRGDGQDGSEIVPAGRQRLALGALLGTLQPEVLALDENVVRLIAPRPPEFERGRETFSSRTDPVFDPLVAAEAAANHSVGLILHPARAARLVQFHARDDRYLSLEATIDELLDATWKSSRKDGFHAELGRTVDNVVLHHLMRLAADMNAAPQVRAVAESKLADLMDWLDRGGDVAQEAHFSYARSTIGRFLDNPAQFELSPLAVMPAGAPI